mmetsp:Transcript_6342/g.9235  ORF Transcript_6342/g.9235 Transcript_6342/m.9235 type:complete len:431 (-) Transcript_6342:49-1341(-)
MKRAGQFVYNQSRITIVETAINSHFLNQRHLVNIPHRDFLLSTKYVSLNSICNPIIRTSYRTRNYLVDHKKSMEHSHQETETEHSEHKKPNESLEKTSEDSSTIKNNSTNQYKERPLSKDLEKNHTVGEFLTNDQINIIEAKDIVLPPFFSWKGIKARYFRYRSTIQMKSLNSSSVYDIEDNLHVLSPLRLKMTFKKKKDLVNYLLFSGKILPVNSIATILFSSGRMRKSFRERSFRTRLSASVNYLDEYDKVFKIRNLFCKNLLDVFLQSWEAMYVVQTAARHSDHLVHLPERDRWFINNMLQSSISERYSANYFLRAANLPTHSEAFIFCLVNEHDQEVKKLRLILVREELLHQIIKSNYTMVPQFENINGKTRWNTIVMISKAYKSQVNMKKRELQQNADLGRVEIVVPLAANMDTASSACPPPTHV